MDTDKFKKRLSIQEDTGQVSDGAGGFQSAGGSTNSNYQEVTKTWAKISPARGTRALEYQKIKVNYPVIISMRYRKDLVSRFSATEELNVQYRFQYTDAMGRTRTYIPHSIINPDQSDWFFQIVASESSDSKL